VRLGIFVLLLSSAPLHHRLHLPIWAQRQRLGKIRRYHLVRNQEERCTLSKSSDQEMPLHHSEMVADPSSCTIRN